MNDKRVAQWNILDQIYRQICRYYPGDERPARSKDVSLNGPMLKVALEHGVRGWLCSGSGGGGPLSMGAIEELLSARMFNAAKAYADYKIEDKESGRSGLCLWELVRGGVSIQFLSPGYAELQKLRLIGLERGKIKRATKAAKGHQRALATRTDII